MVKLGDHIEILSGFAFKSDRFNNDRKGLPLVRIRDVKPGKSETYYDGEFEKRYLLSNGDMLVGMDGEFNCARWNGGPALLNQRVCRIRATSAKVDEQYLYWFLPKALKEIEDRSNFVTVKHLSSKQINEIQIPLPPLEEQKRIAAILDQADDIRRKRQHAIDRLNQLGQAIFYEMFGDPATNPRGWKTDELGELAAKFSDGPFGSNLKSEHYVDEGVRVIRLQNIGVSEFIDRDKAFISYRHFSKLAKHECISGDVIVGTMGDPNLRACILPDFVGTALNKADCVQIRPKNGVATSGYLCGLLNSPSTERMAHDLILGQTRARISMGRLKGLRVPVPPFAIQVAYDEKITMIQSIKEIQNRYLDDQFRALQSLQHRAFTGQL